jgi:hypothetical protein
MQPFEKLGAFYLGREYDPDARAIKDDLLLYDAKDLTTHAVCVGMTGSGKTGLCLSLLEEAAIDGIPAIAIDPKGDLGNLALTFPGLSPAEFRPWIDEGEASRKGQTPDEYASSVANLWRKGLSDWGQDGSRIARFREAAELAIYTPGSSAGRQLKVLRSFAAPPAALLEDSDALRERVMASASGLLTLLGLDPDPIRSREHILLATLLQRAWEQGRDLDIATLIREIQAPSIDRIGVMDLDSFFPAKDRFAMSMSLNNLLASPAFATWMEGEPLNVHNLLWNAQGKPRISILSIAHLSDAERMFFVTILLNEVLAWMRTQPGTSSLRALLYMDEIFGFFPPTANPPAKGPMLTLLKQARAYGLGIVLATQNPVDLDYKGLANTGTWFLGRLQTERDKARVIEGLEGASASSGAAFDRPKIEATLAGLKSRVFLMNNVHDNEPALFHTRWALSYLRGPLTRAQIQRLEKDSAAETVASAPAAKAVKATPKRTAAKEKTGQRPVLPADVAEFFVSADDVPSADEQLLYRPALLGTAQLHYVRSTHDVDEWKEISVITALGKSVPRNPWQEADVLENGEPELDREGDSDARFSALPATAAKIKSYSQWSKALSTKLYRERAMSLWKCPALKLTSRPGETEGEFRVRLRQLGREKRDLAVAKIEKRYGPKLARLRDRIRRAEQRVEKEQSQYGQQKMQTAISIGATVLGAMFGRKAASVGTVGRASTAMRGVGRASREKGDIARAARELEAQQEKLLEMEREFEQEAEAIRDAADPSALEIKTVDIRPRKSDITIDRMALVWTPWRVGPVGVATPLFEAGNHS